MPGLTVYSFTDLKGAITHPLSASHVFSGEGTGDITIAMATEKTAHATAADGSILVSRVAGDSGSVSVQIQQNSPLDKWLQGLYNDLMQQPADQWALMALSVRGITMECGHECTGISFQKQPDRSYKAQGEMITWVLMAADIQSR